MNTFYDLLLDDRERADLEDEQRPAAREQRALLVHGRALDDETTFNASPAAAGEPRDESSRGASLPDDAVTPSPPGPGSRHVAGRGAGDDESEAVA